MQRQFLRCSDDSESLYNDPVLFPKGRSKLPDTRHFGRLAGTGIVVLAVAGVFLYLGGWFSPEALTPARFADGFESVDGIYSGFRLNHAKGVCISGSFERCVANRNENKDSQR